MKKLAFIIISLFLTGRVLLAQSPVQGFPPGVFGNRAALDAAAVCSFPTGINLVGRWRADVGVTTVGSNATVVADQSGNSNTMTVGTGTVPWSATGSVNGKPAFVFATASNGALLTSSTVSMGSGSAASFFIVGRQTGSSPAFAGGLVMAVTAQNDYSGANSIVAVGDTSNGSQFTSEQNGVAGNQVSISTSLQYRLGVVQNGTSFVQYVNNVAQSTITGTSLTLTNLEFIAVGGRLNTGGLLAAGQFWDGPISEIVVTNGALNSTQLNNLDTYFTCQWGT